MVRKIDEGQSNGDDASSSAMSLGGSSSLSDVDGDVFLREENVLQWLLALDMQVIGACRADERLKPMLKLNISTGAAEDRLLAHLSQHFDPAEIGMLARCLCIPLVSVRAGKINKQGNLLCPTDRRGNLNVILLPTSELRISFVGDDGHTERVVRSCCELEIEGISGDECGRCFVLKGRDGDDYFWLSEKSKVIGVELLRKMKDLLKKKPSLAELSGISESRLESFGIHLRAYLSAIEDSSSLESSTSTEEQLQPPEVPPFTFMDSFSLLSLPTPTQTQVSSSSLSSSSSFSPYYCCSALPLPVSSSLSSTSESSFTLPSLSSLLSSARSTLPSLDFPPLMPVDPSSSQQIPSFTPLICDSIVHLPVIDFCSSAQPFMVPPETSMSDKGARETLRWLINQPPNSLFLPSLIINATPDTTPLPPIHPDPHDFLYLPEESTSTHDPSAPSNLTEETTD